MVNGHEKGGSEKESEKIVDDSKEKGRIKSEDLTPSEVERAKEWLDKIPEESKPKEKRESGPEILEFEALVASFESTHSLEVLSSITQLSTGLHAFIKGDPRRMSAEEFESGIRNLTPEDAQIYTTMAAAKKDFERPDGIFKKWQVLKNETDITPDKLAELTLQRKRLSAAIGMIQTATGAVDHSIR